MIFTIDDLLGYVDDEFSWEFAFNTKWYTPYNKFLLTKQANLLYLWNMLGVPHEEHKQVFGAPLTIIGFDVDPNTMMITMPLDARSDLVQAIQTFATVGMRHPLRNFQCLTGWINWALNVYPLLRPGLSTMYEKMSGKEHAHQSIWVSVALCRELHWIAERIEQSDGVHLMDSEEWDVDSADLVFYADACALGLGFWSPNFRIGCQHCLSNVDTSKLDIMYKEALAILSALDFAVSHTVTRQRRLVIFTDSFDSVQMFNSLKAPPHSNPILMTAVDIILSSGVLLRVFHIPGQSNVIADGLSCFNNLSVWRAVPQLAIWNFQPPHLTLGADLQ
jgi:hypothetical protein